MKEMWAVLLRPNTLRWAKAVAKALLLFATIFGGILTIGYLSVNYPERLVGGLLVISFIVVFSITVMYFYKRSFDAY